MKVSRRGLLGGGAAAAGVAGAYVVGHATVDGPEVAVPAGGSGDGVAASYAARYSTRQSGEGSCMAEAWWCA